MSGVHEGLAGSVGTQVPAWVSVASGSSQGVSGDWGL